MDGAAAAGALEERFWIEGDSVSDPQLDPECIMAFPRIGVLRSADLRDSIDAAPRWASLVMADRHLGRAGGLLVLGYIAEATREGTAPYRVICTSTCRPDGAGWKLVQRQQTPAM